VSAGLTENPPRLDSLQKSDMKPSVAVAMIIMGAVLILAPIGADYLFQRNLVSLLLKEPSISAMIMPQLSAWYRIVCWLTGSLMLLIGTLTACADARASHYYPQAVDEDEAEAEDEDKEEGK
jgi:hypothetical protein